MFYKAGKYYQSTCKKCHNRRERPNRYQRVKTGFNLLNKETQYGVIEDILNGKLNSKQISNKYDIKYTTYLYWKRKGYISIQKDDDQMTK